MDYSRARKTLITIVLAVSCCCVGFINNETEKVASAHQLCAGYASRYDDSLYVLIQGISEDAYQLKPCVYLKPMPGGSIQEESLNMVQIQFGSSTSTASEQNLPVARKFSRDIPPKIGANVMVDTPLHRGLNLRERPSRYSKRITVLPQGTNLHVIECSGDWIQVETKDGIVGFVKWWENGASYVSPINEAFMPSSEQIRLKIVSITSRVSPGQYATIKIQTVAGAYCTIVVIYKSGPSHAAGLYPKYADNDGKVFWTWRVGTRTTAGTWPIVITVLHGRSTRQLRTSIEVQ